MRAVMVLPDAIIVDELLSLETEPRQLPVYDREIGRLEANGRVVGPRAYCHFPGGVPMHHANAEPCVFVILFHGPFDLEPIEDPAE